MRSINRRQLSARIRIALVGAACAAFVAAILVAARCWHRHRLAQQQYMPPPVGMNFVPAGAFLMGSDDAAADADERPQRRVYVRPFYVDTYEVTNAEFRRFRPEHTYPEGAEGLPVTGVTRSEAEAYCRSVGKRLPSNAEWEKAARGTDGRRYPWGEAFDPAKANVRRVDRAPASDPTAVGKLKNGGADTAVCTVDPDGKLPGGSFPAGVSPYGCHDMAGNVWEWVGDTHGDKGVFGLWRGIERGILRGGAHGYGALQARTSHQGFESLDTTCNDVGFRGAMDAVPD